MMKNNIILTGASSNYFKNLRLLIYTFLKHKEYNNSRLIVYNLGLAKREISVLEDSFNSEHWFELRHFEYEKYPKFVKPEFSTYSWKPIIIHEVLNETKGNVLWQDSANMILGELSKLWEEISSNGSYNPMSSGTLKRWTVQKTLDYMDVPREDYQRINRGGNLCGFSYHNNEIVELVSQWKELALIRECIRPKGANRQNHRDDQSVLTILLLNLERSGKLHLTKDEVDISSGRPIHYISVRNKFSKRSFLPVGFISYHYFLLLRWFDIMYCRSKTPYKDATALNQLILL